MRGGLLASGPPVLLVLGELKTQGRSPTLLTELECFPGLSPPNPVAPNLGAPTIKRHPPLQTLTVGNGLTVQ